jgi:hypothetical protein
LAKGEETLSPRPTPEESSDWAGSVQGVLPQEAPSAQAESNAARMEASAAQAGVPFLLSWEIALSTRIA